MLHWGPPHIWARSNDTITKIQYCVFVDNKAVFVRLNINCEDLKGSIVIYWCVYINDHTYQCAGIRCCRYQQQ